MSIKTICGSRDFIEYLRGKNATFMLSLSVTKTCEIEGITQAGIPKLIDLTPTLDCEFLCSGEVRSLENIATTPKGVPTPALITRAIHLKKGFSNIEILNLGVSKKPKIEYFNIYEFGINPSNSIELGAGIEAFALFEKALEFGKNYKCKDDYIILAESVPSGTTTALATAKVLGYECDNMFSSSFKNTPTSIKERVVDKALSQIDNSMEIFEKLGFVSDNMLIFNAGFILGASYKNKIILAGGTQMASLLLVINSIIKVMGGEYDSKNIALCTTKWVYEDKNSDILGLLNLLDFEIDAYYADFDFALSNHPALKLYDEGEAKEGVGAGGALCYGLLNGLNQEEIVKEIEKFLV